MEYNKQICEIVPGNQIEGFYVISNVAGKTTVSGKPYLSLQVADCSGTVDAKVWDYSGPISEKENGAIVKLRGEVSEYKGALQLTIQRIRLANDQDSYQLSDIVPSAPISLEALQEEIQQMVSSLDDQDYQLVCTEMLNRHRDTFFSIPAAKSVHHGFLNGLLMHTANMLRTADFLADLYREVIDRNLLLTGTLLHDICKDSEFLLSKTGLVSDYSTCGQLLGHLYLGASEVSALCSELNIPSEKSMLLQHMILSHHGDPEFGACVIPQCAESELLSLIDRIDSRMEIYAEVYSGMNVDSFSNRIFALEKKIYRHR